MEQQLSQSISHYFAFLKMSAWFSNFTIWPSSWMTDHNCSLLLCDLPGCGHSVSGQPRVEELYPRLPVQWFQFGADGWELLQAKQTHLYVFRWLTCLVPFRRPAFVIILFTSYCILLNYMLNNYSFHIKFNVSFQAQALGQASIMQPNIPFT